MTPGRAARLLRAAARGRRHGEPGSYSRWALRRLTAAAEAGDDRAVDMLWLLWFGSGDPACWEVLRRLRRPCSGRPLGAFGMPGAAPALMFLDAALGGAFDDAFSGDMIRQVGRARWLSRIALGEPLDPAAPETWAALDEVQDLRYAPVDHPLRDMAGRILLAAGRLDDPATVRLVRENLVSGGAPSCVNPVAVMLLLDAGQEQAEEVFQAATDPRYPREARAEFARIAGVRGRAPRLPADRAAYFLVTGQVDSYRAVDPEGSLLAAAYAAADEGRRVLLREAMAELGDLDLARVLAGGPRPGGAAAMAPEERRYLVDALAERGEYARLWRLLLDLPLTEAVKEAAQLGEWRPSGQDREVHQWLAAIDSRGIDRLARKLERRLAGAGMFVCRIYFSGRVTALSFAPDGLQLAVGGTRRVAALVDLAEAAVVRRHGEFTAAVGQVLHLGDGSFLAAERPQKADALARLMLCRGDGAVQERHRGARITGLAGLDGGFVLADRAGEVLVRLRGQEGLRPVAWYSAQSHGWPRMVTASGSRLAVVGERCLVVGPAAGERAEVVIDDVEQPRSAALHDTRLATVPGDRRLGVPAVWTLPRRPDGAPPATVRPLETTSGNAVGDEAGRISVWPGSAIERLEMLSLGRLHAMSVLPGTGELLVLEKEGDLVCLDPGAWEAGTQRPVDRRTPHARPTRGEPTRLQVSADGALVAVGSSQNVVDVYDRRPLRLPEMLHRPLAQSTVLDLATVAAAERLAASWSEGERAVLRALRACLEHRFRHDIALAPYGAVAAGEFEIALGE